MDRAVSFELFPQKNKAENRCITGIRQIVVVKVPAKKYNKLLIIREAGTKIM